jgi:hypothetical protein
MTEEEKKPLFHGVPTHTLSSVKSVNVNENQGRSQDRPLWLDWLPGLLLILMGGLFLLSHYGYLEGTWWQYFLVGLAVVILIESFFYYRATASGISLIVRLLCGVLIILCSLLVLFDPDQWWPAVMIGAGVIWGLVLIGRKIRRNKDQKLKTRNKK